MADQTARCPVCNAQGMTQIYNSGTDTSISSLCQILQGSKIVSYCSDCGHLAGNGVGDAKTFYEADYKILLDTEEEDQIYEAQNEKIITRTDHQMSLLTEKIALQPGQSVLDYGCAKAAMARKIVSAVPSIDMHLFDVSRMYEPFWDRFVSKEKQAVHQTPQEWNGRFDLVTSFFAFEHISDPKSAMAHIAQLLKSGGWLHMIVPDVFGNAADFIVIDHINHFTRTSLARLMADAGFVDVVIDSTSYRGAMVVNGRKSGLYLDSPNDGSEKKNIFEHALALSSFWSKAADIIRDSERSFSQQAEAAIYGSGFYGAFIHANLENPGSVTCFLDKSPWQQGKTLFGTKILAPEKMSTSNEIVYVGLNPAIAHQVMESQPWFGRKGLEIVFLGGSMQ